MGFHNARVRSGLENGKGTTQLFMPCRRGHPITYNNSSCCPVSGFSFGMQSTKSCSDQISIPRLCALLSLDPAASPAIRMSVFLETLPVALAPSCIGKDFVSLNYGNPVCILYYLTHSLGDTSMKIKNCVANISTLTELKRISSPYVIDYRGLTEEEIKDALVKTGPQYYYDENVRKAIDSVVYHADRNVRIIGPYFLREVLLQKDGLICSRKETDEDIIKWEQAIVDRSNEDLLQKSDERSQELEMMQFVVTTAWDKDDDLSVDEKNLIEKIRERLKVTQTELQIIEAKLGKFPKQSNTLHTHQEIEDVRRLLQQNGLLFAVRDDAVDYDVIPEEIAVAIRKVMNLEIRNYGYSELLKYKAVKSKSYIKDSLTKVGIKTEKYASLDTLNQTAIEQLSPRTLLGGISPRDGLQMADLSKWCGELDLNVSGTKTDLIERVIEFYDALHERDEEPGDERAVYYNYFVELACRARDVLRSQQLIEKDIEMERRFEDVTNYIFEKFLGHKPLKLVGTNHADGALSYKDKIILWDNKSKESMVNLKDHIKQFDSYIRDSDKPVAGFVVFGPEFTPESSLLAMQYQVENGTMISMITALELKELAEKWSSKNEGSAFPLGYLLQSGRFNPQLVAAL